MISRLLRAHGRADIRSVAASVQGAPHRRRPKASVTPHGRSRLHRIEIEAARWMVILTEGTNKKSRVLNDSA
jgi:hypothetical protein